MPQGRQPGRSAEEGACTAPQQPSSAWLDHQEAERHNKVHVRGASSCLPSRLAPAAAPCHCPTFLSRCQAPRIAQGARAQREQRGRCLRRRPWATRHLAGRVDGGPCQQARSHRRGNTRPWRTRPAETRRLGTALRCPPPPPPTPCPSNPLTCRRLRGSASRRARTTSTRSRCRRGQRRRCRSSQRWSSRRT